MLTKTFEYAPQSEGWSGKVMLKIPSWKDRAKLAQELGLVKAAEAPMAEKVAIMASAAEKLTEHIESIDVKFGEHEFKTLEDLGYTKEGSALIMELGMMVIQGISLGKS